MTPAQIVALALGHVRNATWQLLNDPARDLLLGLDCLDIEALLNPDDLLSTDHRYVPYAVFTDPQIAAVGATEEELAAWGTPYVVARQRYADVAYGWALEDSGHFVKLLADPRTWHLLGAHIVGPQASTLIQPLIQAMSFGLRVPDMARGQYWIHPSLPEVVENALLGLLAAHEPPAIEHSRAEAY